MLAFFDQLKFPKTRRIYSAMLAFTSVVATGCSQVDPVLKALGVESTSAISFSGSIQKNLKIYSLSSIQTVQGQCDARVTGLTVSLDGLNWIAPNEVVQEASDLDCSDGRFSISIDPTKLDFGTDHVENQVYFRTLRVRGNFPWGPSADASVVVEYLVDTTPPSLTLNPIPNTRLSSANLIGIAGTCTETDVPVEITIEHSVSGTLPVPKIVCVGGAFSNEVSIASLGDGVVNASAKQTDVQSRSGSASVNFRIDRTPPVVAIEVPIANAQVVNANRTQFHIRGTCTNGDHDVRAIIEGEEYGSVPCVSGVFDGEIDLSEVESQDEPYQLIALQTDAIGNSGEALVAIAVTPVDNVPPNLTIEAPSTPYVNAGNQIAYGISGACEDNGNLVAVYLQGTSLDDVPCDSGRFSTLNVDLSGYPDGSIAFTVRQRDDAGNVGEDELILTKDTNPPAAPTVTFAKQFYNRTDLSPAINYVATEAEYRYRIVHADTSGVVVDWASAPASGFQAVGSFVTEKRYAVQMTARDLAGNWSTISASLPSWTVDTVPPVWSEANRPKFSGLSESNSANRNPVVTFGPPTDNYSASAKISIQADIVHHPTLSPMSPLAPVLSPYQVVLSGTSTYEDGQTYWIRYRLEDEAGNVSTAYYSDWTVDRVGPEFASIDIFHDTTDVSGMKMPILDFVGLNNGSSSTRTPIMSFQYRIFNQVTSTLVHEDVVTAASKPECFDNDDTTECLITWSTSRLNLSDRYRLEVSFIDRVGNVGGVKYAIWEACPPERIPFELGEMYLNARDEVSMGLPFPERCREKAVILEATGESGRDSLGQYISGSSIGSGGYVSAVFAGESLVGKAFSMIARGAGFSSGTSNSRAGGRYAAIVFGNPVSSTVEGGVIAGGGGGQGSHSEAGVPNFPGLGGDSGVGQGVCEFSSGRSICGKNANVAGAGSGGGGSYGLACGAPTAGNQSGVFGTGGNAGNSNGGGGGGGYGGGGGGGNVGILSLCPGGSGGGGGSFVLNNIAGTTESKIAGVGEGEPSFVITLGAPPVSRCPSNYVYVPPVKRSGHYYAMTSSSELPICVAKHEMSLNGGAYVSAPEMAPVVNLTREQAVAACEAVPGRKLISNQQWHAISQIIHWNKVNWQSQKVGETSINRGVTDLSYARDGAGNVVPLTTGTLADECAGTTRANNCSLSTWSNERRTHSLGQNANAPLIWDFSGNVAEFVREPSLVDYQVPISRSPGALATNTFSLFQFITPTAPYAEASVNTEGFGLGIVKLSSTGAAVVRGGSVVENAGVFTTDVTYLTNQSNATTGFRCVYEPAR